MFCASTLDAVQRFQEDRGLRSNGVCDEATWLAIIEAGWKLGDRLLKLSAPQLRGDDVAELQRSLNHVGFDCGRPDGILGPATIRALSDFQNNCGITPDGICGPKTVHMLEVLKRQSGSGPGVASIREHELVRHATSLSSLRIVVGQFGGLSSVTRSVSRSLRQHGATVISTDEYDAAAQASAANRFGATIYVGFAADSNPCTEVAYFAVPAFESAGGHSLAQHVIDHLGSILPAPAVIRGMRLPVLRETRMPAVLCTLGPVRQVVDSTDSITEAIVTAAGEWARLPAPQQAPGSAPRAPGDDSTSPL